MKVSLERKGGNKVAPEDVCGEVTGSIGPNTKRQSGQRGREQGLNKEQNHKSCRVTLPSLGTGRRAGVLLQREMREILLHGEKKGTEGNGEP